MKKIIFFFSMLLIYSIAEAQCINTFQYPISDVTAVNDGNEQTIASDAYSGDFTVLAGLLTGVNYTFSITLNSDSSEGYVTIVDNADGTTVLAHGVSPLTWNANTTDIQLHWTNDSTCSTDTELHTISYRERLPPLNDFCTTAIPINCTDSVIGTTIGATSSEGLGFIDVWYSYTGYGYEELVTISLCNDNTDFDTYMYVLDDCGFNLIASNNDGCGITGGPSEITFLSDGATTYTIAIEGALIAEIGNFELTVSCENVDVPSNDLCTNAIPINCGDVIIGSTYGATDSVGEPSADVWYSYTGNGSEEPVTLSLCNGSDFDTVLRVYDACNGNEIASDNDGCGYWNGPSSLSFISDGISTYYIAIEGAYGNDSGNYEMEISCVPSTIPPNNDCENAIALNCGDTVSGTTIGALDSNGYSPDVYYSYTGNGTVETVTVDLCNNTDFDTYLTVQSTCFYENLVSFNNDFCDTQSSVTFTSDGFTTYIIVVEGNGAADEGNFELNINCVPTSADECSYAQVLDYSVIDYGTYEGMTQSSTEPSCTSGPFVDTWYQFTAPATGTVSITTEIFSIYEANIAVYDGCSMSNELICSTATVGQELMVNNLIVGDIYFIRVWSSQLPSPAIPGANVSQGGGFYSILLETESLSIETPSDISLEFYPNPVKDQLHLSAQLPIETVIVYNVLGQNVFNATPQNTDYIIPMNGLENGIYMVKVIADNRQKTIKVVKE